MQTQLAFDGDKKIKSLIGVQKIGILDRFENLFIKVTRCPFIQTTQHVETTCTTIVPNYKTKKRHGKKTQFTNNMMKTI